MDEEKVIFSIGQKITLKEDMEVEGCFGTKKKYKKGMVGFIGADSKLNAVHWANGDIQVLENFTQRKGYSVSGLAEWIYMYISRELPIDEMLEDYDVEKETFMEDIADALEELGMYDSTGNTM